MCEPYAGSTLDDSASAVTADISIKHQDLQMVHQQSAEIRGGVHKFVSSLGISSRLRYKYSKSSHV